MDCVFCNIVQKQTPAKVFYEDNFVMVIQDILPKAPVHLLVITKEHIPSIAFATDQHEALLGKMVLAAKKVAADQGISDSGYKLIFNVGRDGGQIIPHIHLHVLGGKKIPE
jgi:histidine triad (HIT) family protein